MKYEVQSHTLLDSNAGRAAQNTSDIFCQRPVRRPREGWLRRSKPWRSVATAGRRSHFVGQQRASFCIWNCPKLVQIFPIILLFSVLNAKKNYYLHRPILAYAVILKVVLSHLLFVTYTLHSTLTLSLSLTIDTQLLIFSSLFIFLPTDLTSCITNFQNTLQHLFL